MLEKPAIPDDEILSRLQAAYALQPQDLTFLPLGADPNTAVYRVKLVDEESYFLKLRLGNFEKFCVELPVFLQAQGVEGILAPIPTTDGHPWATMGEIRLILYPFVDGQDGYEVELRDEDWVRLGRIIRNVHGLDLPQELKARIAVEDYSPHNRESLSRLIRGLNERKAADDLTARLVGFLKLHEETIDLLLKQAEMLADLLRARGYEFVLCHADLHAGNVFIDRHDRRLYIIDWDDPVLAPKERDLMFPGGAQGFSGHTPAQEEALFFQGYGEVPVDWDALTHYRIERVVVDLAIFGEVICDPAESHGNREQAFRYLASNFDPGGTIDRAKST